MCNDVCFDLDKSALSVSNTDMAKGSYKGIWFLVCVHLYSVT